MNKKVKAIILALSAMLLVVSTAFVTVSFLTSQDTVVNTFTVGNVKITLDEAKVDTYGVKDGDTRVEANEYTLIPGHEYVKDPTVTVLKGSEKCYVRILVTLTNIDKIDEAFPNADLTTIFAGYDASKWVSNGSVKNGTTRTFEFRYAPNDGIVAKNADADTKLAPLFTAFTVPESITGDKLATIQGTKMTVVAQAIQADGFETEDAAWAAFTPAA